MTTTKLLLPEPKDLLPLLTGLLGRDLTVSSAELADVAPDLDRTRAFVDDDDQPLVYAGSDLAFAMYASAALAMIPKGRAEDAIGAGTPDEDLAEIYTEILNVLTRVLNDTNQCHVRLIAGGSLDVDAMPELTSGVTFAISIDGYGDGHLSLWHA